MYIVGNLKFIGYMENVDDSFEENLLPVEIDFITLNDTRAPRTGGDYVYSVMKDELLKQSYRIREVSVPILIEYLQLRASSLQASSCKLQI
jgi:hypothetical protein